MLDHLRDLNADAAPHGSFGAVVGATIAEPAPEDGVDLDFGGPILAPGVGTQGGTPDTVRSIFGAALRNVVPSISREVLRLGPDVAASAENAFVDGLHLALWIGAGVLLAAAVGVAALHRTVRQPPTGSAG